MPARPRTTPAATAPLTVMTWNVENFFPAGAPSGPPDKQTYDAKVDYLASMIRGLAPDVVALQEVGGQQPADDVAAAVEGGALHAPGRSSSSSSHCWGGTRSCMACAVAVSSTEARPRSPATPSPTALSDAA
jgi:hypothetical protein